MVLINHNTGHNIPLTTEPNKRPPLISLSLDWNLLGPFQTGTREASWGADPLEYLGGFRKLLYEPTSSYPSSLAPFGQVHWTHCHAKPIDQQPDAAEIVLDNDFPVVDWKWLQQVYGWAALQYQAWTRGELIIGGDVPQTVLLYTDNILEVWIDNQHYFGGDYYAYRRAPLVLHLCHGAHKIDVRIIRDIRVMGGKSSSMSARLRAERSEGSLVVLAEKLLISDVVNGTLASPYAAIPARNDGESTISIEKVEALRESFAVRMLNNSSPLKLVAGQIRSVPLYMDVYDVSNPVIAMKITYTINGLPESQFTSTFYHNLTVRDLHAPHKLTFLHPSRVVSYAILRAPSKDAVQTVHPGQGLPVLLNLHGAGLESDSDQVRHMLDEVPDLRAFVLFPSGVTPWSSDDWHDWGFADVKAAIASIADWISQVTWHGPQVDLDKWLVSGHSNGGQGTVYALTHHPDKIIGAAPVSGYLSIQKYVPYQSWHEADTRVRQVVQSSLQSFTHELMVENFMGLPVLHQHGSEDDNVPAFHSRRLYQLVSQSSEVNATCYVELPRRGHWYEGVMTTPPLTEFYDHCLAGEAKKPALPQNFQIVVSNPADMTSRGGLQVDQLVTPDQLGKISVTWDAATAGIRCQTSNIRRFHFVVGCNLMEVLAQLVVDGQLISDFQTVKTKNEGSQMSQYLLLTNSTWTVSQDSQWQQTERSGRQLGPLQAILRTQDRLCIQCLASGGSGVALQISRNLYQYLGTDAEILEGQGDTTSQIGNLATVSIGINELPKPSVSHPIEIDRESGVIVRTRHGSTKQYAIENGLGAIFLRPLANERLEVVVWGVDEAGLRQAARLFPMLTGVGQPDFIVVRSSMGWKGAAGALAMGSFDSHWQISEASFLQ